MSVSLANTPLVVLMVKSLILFGRVCVGIRYRCVIDWVDGDCDRGVVGKVFVGCFVRELIRSEKLSSGSYVNEPSSLNVSSPLSGSSTTDPVSVSPSLSVSFVSTHPTKPER